MAKPNTAEFDIYGGVDPREIPAYRYVDAARYLNIASPTLRSFESTFDVLRCIIEIV
jgi:hypothetical protein